MHACLMSALVLANCSAESPFPVAPGEPVPALAGVRWLQGEPVAEFEKGRVYVLEFWSTWCAACVESIPKLNELAARFHEDATFLWIHVWPDKSAMTAAEFLEKRIRSGKPVVTFPVVEDVDGRVASAWLEATHTDGLPTAMIVDRESRLAWFGHARDLPMPLEQVIEGTYDYDAVRSSITRKIEAGRLGKQSGNAIEAGDYDRGIRLLMEALEKDPDTACDWVPSTYGHLLHRSRSTEVAEKLVAPLRSRDGGTRAGVFACEGSGRLNVLAGLAHVILHFEPKELRDLELALQLAREAQALSGGRDSRITCLAARTQAEQGDRAGAIRELEEAMAGTTDQNARELFAKTLHEIRKAG